MLVQIKENDCFGKVQTRLDRRQAQFDAALMDCQRIEVGEIR